MKTAHDAFEELLGFLGELAAGSAHVMVREAINEGLREVGNAFGWSYYKRFGRIVTSDDYSTGTVAYDHCVTEEHEALTPQGWKRHEALRVGDLILAYDHQTGTCRWEQIQVIHRSFYQGQLLNVSRRGRNVLRCTKQHRFPVFKRFGGNKTRTIGSAGFVVANELTGEDLVPLTAPVEFNGNSPLSPRLAAILGWAITDGSGLLDKQRNYGAAIYQSVKVNHDNCVAIQELTGTAQRGPYRSSGNCASWSIPPKVARQIKEAISRTEDLPWFVTRLSPESAQAMFDAMLAAEGSCTAAGRLCFTQWQKKRRPIAEAFQILAIMLGKPANFCERRYPQGIRYQVTVRTSKHFKPARLSQWTEFSGPVWCPQVKSGAWVCRCNGAVTITGNSGGATCERQLTLSSGTWPSWAARGIVVIASIPYTVAERWSSTVLELASDTNPGDDVAAATTYAIYQEDYDLPATFKAILEPVQLGNNRCLEYLSPGEFAWRRARHPSNTGEPIWYTVAPSQDTMGRMALFVHPLPTSRYAVTFMYHAIPRQVSVFEYKEGTISTTSGSPTVTGSGTTWTSSMEGAMLRISDSASKWPTGPAGAYPAVQEAKILKFVSTTSVRLDANAATTYSGVKYLISDPIDVDEGAMKTLFSRAAEKQLAIRRRLSRMQEIEGAYWKALEAAQAGDSRAAQQRFAGDGYKRGRMLLKDMPLVGNAP